MQLQQLSGEELLHRCAGSADGRLWAEFHRRFHPTIAGVVMRTLAVSGLPALEEVEDLVHDVYVRVSMNGGRALKSFVPAAPGSEYAYLKVIARNVVLDRLDRRKKEPEPAADLGEEHERVPRQTDSDSLDRQVMLGKIDDILRRTASERDRRIFSLYYKVGLSAREISEMRSFGLSESGVESVLGHVVRRIRGELR